MEAEAVGVGEVVEVVVVGVEDAVRVERVVARVVNYTSEVAELWAHFVLRFVGSVASLRVESRWDVGVPRPEEIDVLSHRLDQRTKQLEFLG